MEFNKAERQFSAVMGPGLQMGSSKEGLPPISRRQARAGEEEETSKLMGPRPSSGYKDALTATTFTGWACVFHEADVLLGRIYVNQI